MTRGFEAVLVKLDTEEFEDLSRLLDCIGTSLISSIGGASGIIFGTWFRSGARGLSGKMEFDGWSVMQFLREGLMGIQSRSKAVAGDKTMLDVVIPACTAAERTVQDGLEASLEGVARAAEQGVEDTKAMIAKIGRARTLGERAIGFPDPGAVSAYIILSAMNRFVKGEQD